MVVSTKIHPLKSTKNADVDLQRRARKNESVDSVTVADSQPDSTINPSTTVSMVAGQVDATNKIASQQPSSGGGVFTLWILFLPLVTSLVWRRM